MPKTIHLANHLNHQIENDGVKSYCGISITKVMIGDIDSVSCSNCIKEYNKKHETIEDYV